MTNVDGPAVGVGGTAGPSTTVHSGSRHLALRRQIQKQPNEFGLGGNCGQATALWVHEQLPLGWGDTYSQTFDGQNFNVTHLPNGTYYIEIIANPEKVLHETNTANNTTLRKIILGGTPDHRTLRVPPFTA